MWKQLKLFWAERDENVFWAAFHAWMVAWVTFFPPTTSLVGVLWLVVFATWFLNWLLSKPEA